MLRFRRILPIVAGAFIAAGAQAADNGEIAPTAPAKPAADPLSPPEVVKPVIPGKSELADSAFKKLDPTGKGYVTPEDTKGLDGFEQSFRDADAGHTGKLDFPKFRKAWAQYTGYKQ